jgi:Ca-activated chloride channel family protein
MRSLALTLLVSLILGSLAATVTLDARPVLASPQGAKIRPRRVADALHQATPMQQSPTGRGESAEQDDEMVTVEIDLTNVLFTAVDKNKQFSTMIRQSDIRVLEDGVPQEIFTFQRETDRPLSLAILIDTSASQKWTLPMEKAAARAFVDAIIREGRDEVAVLSFTGETTLEQELTGTTSRVRRAIDQVELARYSSHVGKWLRMPRHSSTSSNAGASQPRIGTTAIWDAVWITAEAVLSGTSDKTRRGIIVLTDGIDTSSRLKRIDATDRAVRADTVIYAIGIGGGQHFDQIEKDALRKLSEPTGGRVYLPQDETDLRAAFAQIERELRSQYLVAYCPSNKKHDGSFRHVKIEVVTPEMRKQKLRLNYRQGYFAKHATFIKN